MTIELDLLLVELRNRTYTDKTIPAVVYYLEILSKQLRLARDVASLKEAQGQHGTWDSDDYMRGLFNGLELASSILEQREPKFKPVFTDIEKKDEEIRTLKRCLFQMQEALSLVFRCGRLKTVLNYRIFRPHQNLLLLKAFLEL